MRARGHAVESICAVLRGQGVQVAARSYRAWKSRLPALRTLEDARITDALRGLKVPDGKGRPRPGVIYGRRKMTVWLRRNGFPEASKHTVDRLMRAEGMNGLVRAQDADHDPRQGRREGAGSAESGLPRPGSEPYLGHGFHLCSSLVRVRLRRPGHRPVLPGHRGVGDIHGQGHRVRGALPAHGAVAA
jgi:hypothetical protein